MTTPTRDTDQTRSSNPHRRRTLRSDQILFRRASSTSASPLSHEMIEKKVRWYWGGGGGGENIQEGNNFFKSVSYTLEIFSSAPFADEKETLRSTEAQIVSKRSKLLKF
ncbi:unnamed protein product [Eruca vesicaria subsp. sativa]|uniref:Uncharacterized protein n=1 Tax=Eruca vesicaria subsp. sativa TaxID=29727 RepID=A0ABC8LZ26_ERUVS|nr:unnamed protein product [Eruca vesicaria subsp. sativa]